MLLDDIAAYLDANSTALLVGSTGNLFKGIMLDEGPNTVTVLYEGSGQASVKAFSTSTGSVDRLYEQPTLDVLCRSTSYQTARTNAETVFGLLDGLVDQTLSGTRYRSIEALGSPGFISRDQNERFVIGVTFDVQKEIG